MEAHLVATAAKRWNHQQSLYRLATGAMGLVTGAMGLAMVATGQFEDRGNGFQKTFFTPVEFPLLVESTQ